MIERQTGWCILRTSARATLGLAADLSEAGYEVWTPIAKIVKRTGKARDRVEVDAPIMPSFVFGRADRLEDLFNLSHRAIKDCAAFSVMRYGGRIPIVANGELASLRQAEMRAKPKEDIKPLAVDTEIRMTEGAFAGLPGIVKQSDGRHTLVCFGGRLMITVETWQLAGNLANSVGIAA